MRRTGYMTTPDHYRTSRDFTVLRWENYEYYCSCSTNTTFKINLQNTVFIRHKQCSQLVQNEYSHMSPP